MDSKLAGLHDLIFFFSSELSNLILLFLFIDSLLEKELMIELTPPGRGQLVTHNLYEAAELDSLKSRCASGAVSAGSPAPPSAASSSAPSSTVEASEAESLKNEIRELRSEVQMLRQRIQDLESRIR